MMEHSIFWDANEIAYKGAWAYSAYLEGRYEQLLEQLEKAAARIEELEAENNQLKNQLAEAERRRDENG